MLLSAFPASRPQNPRFACEKSKHRHAQPWVTFSWRTHTKAVWLFSSGDVVGGRAVHDILVRKQAFSALHFDFERDLHRGCHLRVGGVWGKGLRGGILRKILGLVLRASNCNSVSFDAERTKHTRGRGDLEQLTWRGCLRARRLVPICCIRLIAASGLFWGAWGLDVRSRRGRRCGRGLLAQCWQQLEFAGCCESVHMAASDMTLQQGAGHQPAMHFRLD